MTSVLMTADTVGGVWTYALDLAWGLADHGVEVSLATMGRSLSAGQWDEVGASAIAAVYESDFALEWMDDPWADVERAGEWLLQLEAALAPDFVHLNGYTHAALPWRAPTIVVAHSCVLSWWQAVHGVPAPPSWSRYRDMVGAGLQAASTVIAPTRAMLGELRRCYGFEHGVVIPNGRRTDWVQTRPKEQFALSAGRMWDPAKNLRSIERVAPNLGWPVFVAGETSGVLSEEAAAAAVGMLGPLAFVDLAEWMARATIFVLPARYEPFGLAALEAGLSGCALVLGDIPSLREVWGGAALFVDPDDDEALFKALRMLMDDPGRCHEMGHLCRLRAARYRLPLSVKVYLAEYAHAAGKQVPIQ